MSRVGQKEIATQRRVVRLLRKSLEYEYLGDWDERPGNSNLEEDILRSWLTARGHADNVITKVLREVDLAKSIGGGKNLYDANRAVYGLLRYGVKVKAGAGELTQDVWLIDWEQPENNHFAVAEEVTIAGEHTKRPDLVIYVNGIALGVIELKRSTIAIGEGIRQNLLNQRTDFIEPFFSTVQLIMAGSDTEGLHYGVIKTPAQYYMQWKEKGSEPNVLDRALGQICRKERFLELVHDFIVFDAGIKKVCRHNQYFGVRLAQDHVRRRQGGIIWHTQGSGKTLTMVWLARWIYEHVPDARVLLLTDRTELDEQLQKVFLGVNEAIYRTTSGADLIGVLNRSDEWLIGSLVHKFGSSSESAEDEFVAEMQEKLPKDFRAKRDIFVFVDECHRTHRNTGKMHNAMKALLPGAMFIGFTGTPLLKKDIGLSVETFGPYIHKYKYDEAVADRVVLDLRYEARDINQIVVGQDKVDQWFDAKTKGLTEFARAQLKRRWGTMQRVLSADDRLDKIAADILLDMELKDRLSSGHGNAILVAASIYEACRFFEKFAKTDLGGKCAIVTSYTPSASAIAGEDAGEGETEKLMEYDTYRKMLAAHFNEPEATAVNKVQLFEKEVKERFIKEPGQMKLLIVVDKLLTGFDAPSATYLYLDKHLQDHGLFQAVCRVNRLDKEDKSYGYIVDYKDLFHSLKDSYRDYTGTGPGEPFEGYDADDVVGLLKDRLTAARERLVSAQESIRALCEPVQPPRDTQAYVRFFCPQDGGDSDDDQDELDDTEPRRVSLYKLAGELLRAYADLANEMEQAGYSADEAQRVKTEVDHYEKVREEVKLASGDYIDMKIYEPAMRQLLDTYIRADPSEKVSAFDDLSLVDLFVQRGEAAVDLLPEGIRRSPEAMAETIANNIRKVTINEMAVNPKYYEKMSELLEALVKARKDNAIAYKEYLEKIVALAKQIKEPEGLSTYPASMDTPARRALFDNLDRNEELADRIDTQVRGVKKDGWRGNKLKEREILIAIKESLGADAAKVGEIVKLVTNQRGY